MKNKSKNKIISLILALGCFLSGYSYIDNSLTVYASGEEVDASKIVGALDESETVGKSQIICCNCGKKMNEETEIDFNFLGKSKVNCCKECWKSEAYKYLRESQKGNKLDIDELILKDNISFSINNLTIRAHRRDNKHSINDYSDYIFRVSKTVLVTKYMDKEGRWNDTEQTLTKESMKRLINLGKRNKSSESDIFDIKQYCKSINIDGNNEDAIIGASSFIAPKREHQKTEEKRNICIDEKGDNENVNYIIKLQYVRTDYLTCDNKWIDFSSFVSNYEDLQRKSHFGIPNLSVDIIEKKREDYSRMAINSIKNFYKCQKDNGNPLNIDLTIKFDGRRNSDIYRIILQNSNIIKRQRVNENGKYGKEEYFKGDGEWCSNSNSAKKILSNKKIYFNFYKSLLELLIEDM